MNVSIAIAYYNRLEIFKKTLQSIALSKLDKDLYEVVVCDDASNEENKLTSEVFKECGIKNFKLITIKKELKKWTNPCIPYNIAFRHCDGETIIVQNPEVIHLSDVLSYVNNSMVDELYLSINCYASSLPTTNKLLAKRSKSYKDICRFFMPFREDREFISSEHENNWYSHPIYRPVHYHFCCAVKKKMLLKIGGFDEIYKDGVAYDDDDFVLRIKRLGLKMVYSNLSINVCHLYHGRVLSNLNNEKIKINRDLYEIVLKDPMTGYKPRLTSFKLRYQNAIR